MRDVLESLKIATRNAGTYAGSDWVRADEATCSLNPSTGAEIAMVELATGETYDAAVSAAQDAFTSWRQVPGPARGLMVRGLGEALRRYKEPLGKLVSLEMGKIYQEGLGEVQEMIDICDFAVGLSRQLYGLTMQSERPQHRMMEQWQPLGPVGIISAFNFPVAVWCWNAAIAAVCGDTCVWKPSPKTPLTAIAVQHICNEVMREFDCPGVFNLVVGDERIGAAMANDTRLPLISATGSTRMGRSVAAAVGARLGRSILELGGNNAIIVDETADLDLATRAIVFGAVGTAGQRCTSTRRIIAHRAIAEELSDRVVAAYGQVTIGDPLADGTLMGPLIDDDAVSQMMSAIEAARAAGGEVLCGGARVAGEGHFVTPCVIRASAQYPIIQHETFAPILYLLTYDGLEEAIALNNEVSQGLSSSIFTSDVRRAERFVSAIGSDCGIANVNIGTSGAEIGGAFGGEKDTGGGREAGSDSWKAYMRRQTNTINWSPDLPLAQGISFG